MEKKKTCPMCRTNFDQIIIEAHIGATEEVSRPEDVAREESLGVGIPAPVPVPASPGEYQYPVVPFDFPIHLFLPDN